MLYGRNMLRFWIFPSLFLTMDPCRTDSPRSLAQGLSRMLQVSWNIARLPGKFTLVPTKKNNNNMSKVETTGYNSCSVSSRLSLNVDHPATIGLTAQSSSLCSAQGCCVNCWGMLRLSFSSRRALPKTTINSETLKHDLEEHYGTFPMGDSKELAKWQIIFLKIHKENIKHDWSLLSVTYL